MLSQREAARRWNVSRITIQRAIKAGKLSILDDGLIDPAEMLRVFGEGRSHQREPLEPDKTATHETALQAEIQALRAALAAKDEVIAAKDRNLEDLRQALKLLEGPPTQRSLWTTLFSRRRPLGS